MTPLITSVRASYQNSRTQQSWENYPELVLPQPKTSKKNGFHPSAFWPVRTLVPSSQDRPWHTECCRAAKSGPSLQSPIPIEKFVLVKAPVWIALVAGIVITTLVTGVIWKADERVRRDGLERMAQDRADLIRWQILRSTEVLQGLVAFLESRPEISRGEFRKFVSGALARHPDLQALAWNPVVPGAERPAWEQRARAEGFSGFEFTQEKSGGGLETAAERPVHYPVYFLESLEKNVAAFGFDVGSESRRLAALERARDTGESIATEPIRLAQESGSQLGFIVFHPIYTSPANTFEERRAALSGFCTAVFRIGDLIELTLRPSGGNPVLLTVFDRKGSEIYRQEGRRASGLSATDVPLSVAGEHWNLRFEPAASFGGAGSRLAALGHARRRAGHHRSARLLPLEQRAAGRRVEPRGRCAPSGRKLRGLRESGEVRVSRQHEPRDPHADERHPRLLADSAHATTRCLRSTATPSPPSSSSGDHLLHLINEILDLSKIDAGRMELAPADFDLTALVREIAAMFQHPCEEKQLGLRIEGLDRRSRRCSTATKASCARCSSICSATR